MYSTTSGSPAQIDVFAFVTIGLKTKNTCRINIISTILIQCSLHPVSPGESLTQARPHQPNSDSLTFLRGHSYSYSIQSSATSCFSSGQPCLTNHSSIQAHSAEIGEWKVRLGPAGSIQCAAPAPPSPSPQSQSLLTSPSLLGPVLLWAVIDMWITVCGDDNKSANRGQA